MQLQCICANLMICSLKLEKDVFKNAAWDFVLLLLVLKLYPIQVVISLPLWIKFPMDQFCSFFCETSAAFLAYVGGVLGTKLSSQFVTDRYILAIQQIITHEEHLRYSCLAIFGTA